MPFNLNTSNCAPAFHYQKSLAHDYEPHLEKPENELDPSRRFLTGTTKPPIKIKEAPEDENVTIQTKEKWYKKIKRNIGVFKAKVIDLFRRKKTKIECPILLKETSHFVRTNCGHSFSLKAFQEFMKNAGSSPLCPSCRQCISNWVSNGYLGIDQNLKFRCTKGRVIYLST